MKKPMADLHVHTNFSDSTFSPEQVVKTAAEVGLSAIAITDHDCVDGIEPSIKLAAQYSLEIIPGIELTVDNEGYEVHMLGYFVDWQDQAFRTRLKTIQDSRINRIYKMTELLRAQDVDITAEEVFNVAGCGSVGRLHVARALMEKGKVRSMDEAFSRYIGASGPCYVEHLSFTPKEAIELLRSAGGVPVLAHPRVTRNDRFVPEFVTYGLRGIEVYHTDHDRSAEKRYLKMAQKHDLLITGGSDCHGIGKGRILLGTVMVDYALVKALREESDRIKRAG